MFEYYIDHKGETYIEIDIFFSVLRPVIAV